MPREQYPIHKIYWSENPYNKALDTRRLKGPRRLLVVYDNTRHLFYLNELYTSRNLDTCFRLSEGHFNLKNLSVDTLILVGDISQDYRLLALERLSGQMYPQIYEFRYEE